MTTPMPNEAAAPRAAVWKEETRATLSLAGPIVLTQLSQIAILTTDILMIGRLGRDALAAASLALALFFVFFVVCMGIVMATAGLAAQAYGARRPRDVRRVIRQGLWVAAVVGAPSFAVLQFTEPALTALGQAPVAVARAWAYMSTLSWMLVPAVWFIVLRNFVSALARPRPALWVMMAGIPLNVVLNYALIFGELGMPRLELVGAGLASTIVNSVMCAAMLAVTLWARPFRRYNLLGRFWRADWPRFRRIFVIGAPIGGAMLLEVGVFSAAAILIGWLGTTALAAHQIALQIPFITFMVPMGIGQAATVRVGHAIGRRDPVGVRRAGWSAIALGLAFMAVMGAVILALPEFLAGLFVDGGTPSGAAVIRLAAAFLVVAALFQLVDGAQVIGAGALRGLNDTRLPMLFAGIGYWAIGFSTGYLLAFEGGLGGVGVWIGLALGLGTVAVLMLARFRLLTRNGLPAAAVAEAA